MTLDKSQDIPRYVIELEVRPFGGIKVRMVDQMMHRNHSDGSPRYIDLENSSPNSLLKIKDVDVIVMMNEMFIDCDYDDKFALMVCGRSNIKLDDEFVDRILKNVVFR